MSSTIYGNLRKQKLDLLFVGGVTGSFVTPLTGRKSTTLQDGLVGYYRLGQGAAGTIA